MANSHIVTGLISGAGAITAGTGFSVVRNGAGDYTVTFTDAFAATPLVLVMNTDTGHAWIEPIFLSAPAAGSFRISLRDTANLSQDGNWQFLAFLVG